MRHSYLRTMLPDAWQGRISLLAKTPQELEARVSALYLDIALDGVGLHDCQDYNSTSVFRAAAWAWREANSFSWVSASCFSRSR